MPTRPNSSTARWSAAARSLPRCCSSVSVIWRPIVRTGFSEVIGSWNTMPISLPRIRRISSSESVIRSRPANHTSPPVMRPGGSGMRRMTDNALTDLPEPLSPTIATVSPGSTVYEMPSTARTIPAPVRNSVCNSLTSRSGGTPIFLPFMVWARLVAVARQGCQRRFRVGGVAPQPVLRLARPRLGDRDQGAGHGRRKMGDPRRVHGKLQLRLPLPLHLYEPAGAGTYDNCYAVLV